jgi:LuxR family maltose regulon positive regulatory protein
MIYHESFLSAYLTVSRAATFRNDRVRALMLLNRAERLAGERGWMRLVGILLLERVRLLAQGGQMADAGQALAQLQGLRNQYPAPHRCSWSEIHIVAAVAEGIVATASGRLADAIQSLTWAFEQLLVTDNRHGALRVGLDLSKALFLAGVRDRALDVFKQIVGWAAEAGAETFLLERKVELGPLYSAAAKQLPARDASISFLQRLLNRSTSAQGDDAAAVRKAGLTDRERSIVEFIATGQSNKQIARTLGVTPETVKTHLKRIFVKLSAETRAQAVVRAQSLGLLRNVAAL